MGNRYNHHQSRSFLHHQNYLYRFPVEYTDLLAKNQDDRFSGSNSSGSLLLRQDALCDSDLDFIQPRNRKLSIKKRKRRKELKFWQYFNKTVGCLLFLLAIVAILFYWSMWLVKMNSTTCDFYEKRNVTGFDWEKISPLLMGNFDKDRIRENLRWLSKNVHVAGTKEQLSIMDRLENEYRNLGFKVKSYEYEVLLSYPDYEKPNTIHVWSENEWTFISNGVGSALGPNEDQNEEKQFVWWNAYSSNGTIFAPIVYVNYGTEEDFELLKKAGIQIEGRIVLVRYGSNFRAEKVALAQENGALGVILYSDPFDFSPESQLSNSTFPHSIWLPESETQRGTLLQTNGDPETPIFPSKEYTHRSVSINELYKIKILPSIPVTPISYRDAKKIFKKLNGEETMWPHWKGSLPIPYKLNGNLNFRLDVRSRLERRKIKNLMSTWQGDDEKFVILSNHVDAWTKGAIDPNSGTAVMLEAARVLSETSHKTAWRPRRSIAFCHFDAEEFGLIGSTEFVEEMLKPLEYRAIALINVDNVNGNTTIVAKAVPLLYKTLARAASLVNQPNENERQNGRLTLLDSWKFHGGEKGPLVGDKSVPAIKLPLFGSDFQPFISYIGVPVADIRIESAPIYNYAIYHSAHETAWTVEKFIDPTGNVFVAMGQFWLEVARDLADSPIIPFDVVDYGIMLGEFLRRLDLQLRHLGIDEALTLEWYGKRILQLETAASVFQKLASRLNHYIQKMKNVHYDLKLLNNVNERLFLVERSFIIDQGLWPDSPMKRHVIFSSGKHRDIFPGAVFALILDPALKWANVKNNELLEEIRMAFTKLQYCIESANHLLYIENFH